MKVLILAGGKGTRISEYTREIPKPMIPIGGKPIIHHIMQAYAKYNHKEFYIAIGYKGNVIKEYFKDNRPCRTTVEISSLPTPINLRQMSDIPSLTSLSTAFIRVI